MGREQLSAAAAEAAAEAEAAAVAAAAGMKSIFPPNSYSCSRRMLL